jgi:hypothetical protein
LLLTWHVGITLHCHCDETAAWCQNMKYAKEMSWSDYVFIP